MSLIRCIEFRPLRRTVVLLGGLCFSALAGATSIINGNFDQGLTGWNVWGYAATVGAPGEPQAYLVNGVPNGSWDAGALGGVASTALPMMKHAAPYVDLPGGATATARDPSYIWQQITVDAGDVLSFRYTFQGEMGCPAGIQYDWAFMSLGVDVFSPLCGGGTPTSGPVLDLALREATPTPGSYPATYAFGPTYWDFSHVFDSAGSFTLAFAVVDGVDGDPTVNSGLLIDDVRITRIPEPPTLALLGLALGGVVLRRHIGLTRSARCET